MNQEPTSPRGLRQARAREARQAAVLVRTAPPCTPVQQRYLDRERAALVAYRAAHHDPDVEAKGAAALATINTWSNERRAKVFGVPVESLE